MNFLALCQKVRSEAGITGTGPASVTGQSGILARIVNWVQQSNLAIQLKNRDWQFLFNEVSGTLVAGTYQYLPADLGMTQVANSRGIDLAVINGKELEVITWQQYRDAIRAYGKQSDSGTPRFITVSPHGKIYLYPNPDEAITINIDFYQRPVDMTNNTDTSVIPDEYHWVIVWQSVMHYALNEEDDALYVKAEIEFNRLFTQMGRDYLPEMTEPSIAGGFF